MSCVCVEWGLKEGRGLWFLNLQLRKKRQEPLTLLLLGYFTVNKEGRILSQ